MVASLRMLSVVVVFCAVACQEDPNSNTVTFDFSGESYDWSSDEGSCQFRNMNSLLACSLDVGEQPDEEDLTFSLAVDFNDVIEETSYTDVQETEFPNIELSLWMGGCRYDSTSDAEQTLTIARIRDESLRGDFTGTLECADSGESASISGTFFMSLTP